VARSGEGSGVDARVSVTDFPDLDRDLPLLTVASVAEYLSVDETTVRRLVKRGEIRGRHVGDTVRVSPRDLRDYLCRAVIHVPKPLPPLPSPPSGPGARGSRWWCAGTARGDGGARLRRVPSGLCGLGQPIPSAARTWDSIASRFSSPSTPCASSASRFAAR